MTEPINTTSTSQESEQYIKQKLMIAVHRIWKSPYFISFFLFICAQTVFLIAVKFDWFVGTLSRDGIEEIQTAFFIVSVNALLFINTAVFLMHVIPLLSLVDSNKNLNEKCRKNMKDARTIFLFSMTSAAFLCGVTVMLISFKMMWNPPALNWHTTLNLSEIVAGLVFALFVIADLCCLDTVLLMESQESVFEIDDMIKVVELKQSLQKYLLAVDAPGFIGIIIIICSSHVLFDSVQFMYWEGFTAGAIGLHIMFSQVALFLLSAIEKEH